MKIKAKKSLGQHWLRDKATLFDVVTAAEITKDDTVLEVGPASVLLPKYSANLQNK